MISKSTRLPRDEFKARGYKTTPTPFFLVKTKRNGGKYPRIGIVIGKAIYKGATARNFWKRQAKAAFLEYAPESTDLLIIFTSHKGKLTKKQLRSDLAAALNTIKK